MKKTWVQSLGQEDPLEKEMGTRFSILAWESHGQMNLVGYNPWGRKRVWQDLSDQTTATNKKRWPIPAEMWSNMSYVSSTKNGRRIQVELEQRSLHNACLPHPFFKYMFIQLHKNPIGSFVFGFLFQTLWYVPWGTTSFSTQRLNSLINTAAVI